MCYNIRFLTERKIKYAKRLGASESDISQLESELEQKCNAISPVWYANAFSHPSLLCVTNQNFNIELIQWGLIPVWTKDEERASEIRNQTFNARSESVFEKPAFRQSIAQRRCLVVTDGFYEYHHFNKKSYPYHVVMKNGEPMVMAGIFSLWANNLNGNVIKTVSIVTTKANSTLTKIHNNPDRNEPRIPIILQKNDDYKWLYGDNATLMRLMNPIEDAAIDAYTVPLLAGTLGAGNSVNATRKTTYPELEYKNNLLF